MDLKSTFWEYELVTQITHFKWWDKLTHTNLIPKTIKEWRYSKIKCAKWYWVSFNSDNINCFETHPQIDEEL